MKVAQPLRNIFLCGIILSCIPNLAQTNVDLEQGLVDMELVKQTLNQVKPLAPAAPAAASVAPILLLATPSVAGMVW